METLFGFLATYLGLAPWEENTLFTPHQGPEMQASDGFFLINMNRLFNNQLTFHWCEMKQYYCDVIQGNNSFHGANIIISMA